MSQLLGKVYGSERVIKLFKDAHALLEFVLFPSSSAWTTYDNQKKLEILFQDAEATPEFVQGFAKSRFGKKILSFRPTLTFKEIDDNDYTPTNSSLYGFESTQVQDVVNAATITKQSAEQRVEFLKAIFPNLARQAEIEDQMELEPDEEFIL